MKCVRIGFASRRVSRCVFVGVIAFSMVAPARWLLSQGCVPARLIAPNAGSVNACVWEGGETPYLQPHQFSASVSYRYLHSFREFHLDEELPFPTDPFLYAETYVHGFDIGFAYQATRRLSLTLDIPVQDGRRTSYYEHDLTTLTEKHTMRASGVGDLRLLANIWIFDPDRHRSGNISLGLGFKLPTGDYNAKDFSYRANGPVLRPVDPAIQPGDGGLGIVIALSGFQNSSGTPTPISRVFI